MPTVIPISDMQRNIGKVASECHETRQPIYLTKNGKASLVVMDAAEFDRRYAALDALERHEEDVRRAIARGYDDVLNGHVRPLDQALADADRIRAANHAG